MSLYQINSAIYKHFIKKFLQRKKIQTQRATWQSFTSAFIFNQKLKGRIIWKVIFTFLPVSPKKGKPSGYLCHETTFPRFANQAKTRPLSSLLRVPHGLRDPRVEKPGPLGGGPVPEDLSLHVLDVRGHFQERGSNVVQTNSVPIHLNPLYIAYVHHATTTITILIGLKGVLKNMIIHFSVQLSRA